MPRRDDSYYRAYFGRFLSSTFRYQASRGAWAAYRDLIDLLHQNGGQVASARAYLRHHLMATDSELDELLACDHVYLDDAGNIRHKIVDDDLADLDRSREWGAAMAARRWDEKRTETTPKTDKNATRNASRNAERNGSRIGVRCPQSVSQSASHSKRLAALTDTRYSDGLDGSRSDGAADHPPVLTPEARALLASAIGAPSEKRRK